ncbi:MAG: DUF4405 domain-containing protein [Selenomonadaceae bacterium]|nr:DUF4405 domain-containing protein [Selenomonadaceae bacterium]MBR1860224.1 DUF4405 domain-containing protein [Selenomonadaceae bacterium]
MNDLISEIMKRFYLNIVLLILFLLIMSFHFIPKVLHEVLGLLVLPVIIVHCFWNWKAFKSSLRGNLKKKLSAIIDIILLLCMVIIISTGICISNHLFNGMIDIKFQRNIIIHQLHVSVPFLFMILAGIHLGLHWQGMWQRIKNIFKLNTSKISYKIVTRLTVAMLIVIGIYGSFLDRVGDRLLMQHIFATDATQLPFAEFIFIMISIFSIYTVIGFILDRYL